MNKKVILFDIDYTLFDTDKFRDLTYPQLMKLLEQEDTPQYHEKVKEIERQLIKKGGYEPVLFAKLLTEVLEIPPKHTEMEKLFYDNNLYESCLYEDVKKTLSTLSQNQEIQLGVVSKGELSFQERKIAEISQYFPSSDRFISFEKTDMIPRILNQYNGSKIVIIDDSVPFLYEVKKADAAVVTCLVTRENRYEKRETPKDFQPDATIDKVEEVIPLVDRISGS